MQRFARFLALLCLTLNSLAGAVEYPWRAVRSAAFVDNHTVVLLADQNTASAAAPFILDLTTQQARPVHIGAYDFSLDSARRTIYFEGEKSILAVNIDTGQPRWTFQCAPWFCQPPVAAGASLYLLRSSQNLGPTEVLRLDPNGQHAQVVYHSEGCDLVTAFFVDEASQTLFVGTRSGRVVAHAFQNTVPFAASSSMADTVLYRPAHEVHSSSPLDDCGWETAPWIPTEYVTYSPSVTQLRLEGSQLVFAGEWHESAPSRIWPWQTLRWLDLHSHKVVARVITRPDFYFSIASPVGRSTASAPAELTQAAIQRRLDFLPDRTEVLSTSPDAKLWLTLSEDGALMFWSAQTHRRTLLAIGPSLATVGAAWQARAYINGEIQVMYRQTLRQTLYVPALTRLELFPALNLLVTVQPRADRMGIGIVTDPLISGWDIRTGKLRFARQALTPGWSFLAHCNLNEPGALRFNPAQNVALLHCPGTPTRRLKLTDGQLSPAAPADR